MDLRVLISNVQQSADRALKSLDNGDEKTARGDLSNVGDMIRLKLRDSDADVEEPAATEEKEQTVGDCQPDLSEQNDGSSV